jgi:hypothetical protein
MYPKNIKRLMLTIGLVIAVITAAIWLILARFDRIIDNPNRRQTKQRQFFMPANSIKSPKNLSDTLQAKNNKMASNSRLLPKNKISDSSPMGRQNEKTAQNDIFDIMASSLREEFPELELSEAELSELSEVVMEMRESIQGLRRIERTSENIALLKELEAQCDQALLDFERITGMSVVEFLRRVPSKGGITYENDPQAPVKFKYLDDFRP